MAKLHFRYGAMNAGKSTILIQTAYNYEERGQTVLIMKPAIDTKGDAKIVSRIGLERDVDVLLGAEDRVMDQVYDKLEGLDCILIDEAQFLTPEQVNEIFLITKLHGVPVIAFGLRADFRTEGFPGSVRLLELADSLEEMPTICSCGRKARFNSRKINGEYILEGDSVLIDGTSEVEYESLCGNCYVEKVMKRTRRLPE